MKSRQWLSLELLICAALMPASRTAAAPVSLSWNGWHFDYDVSARFGGLSLQNVTYHDRPVLAKAGFPVMRAFYDDNICGPLAYRVGPTNVNKVSWTQHATVVSREFRHEGQPWYELGVQANIGDYFVYQAWYLNAEGILDGHVFSKGLPCDADHVHYPYWRLDLDVGGKARDQMRRFRDGRWEALTSEFDGPVIAADGHLWQVRDSITGAAVAIAPAESGWNSPGSGVPAVELSSDEIFVRLHQGSEGTEVPLNDAEPSDNQDLILWYKGQTTYSGKEGPAFWRSTGLRLHVNSGQEPRLQNRAPTIDSPGSQTSHAGTSVDLPAIAYDLDNDRLSFSATGLPPGLGIDQNTGRISGGLPSSSAGTYTVTLGASDGHASATTSFVWSVTPVHPELGLRRFDFESGAQGWRAKRNGGDRATTGRWDVAAPAATRSEAAAMQLDWCATGNSCLVTDGRSGQTAGAYDVDGGHTTITSPAVDLRTFTAARLTFDYYFAHGSNASPDDVFRVIVAGLTSKTVFEVRGSASVRSAEWRTVNIDLNAFVGQLVRIQMQAGDAGLPSLIEAAVDNVAIDPG